MKKLLPFLVFLYCCNSPKKEKQDFEWAPIRGNIYLDQAGDTVNRFDTKNRKQGKWMVWRESANPNSTTDISSLEEQGFYKNDKKEGYWIRFSVYSEIIDSILYKNGIQQLENSKTYTVN